MVSKLDWHFIGATIILLSIKSALDFLVFQICI